jgi:hypothetical protein
MKLVADPKVIPPVDVIVPAATEEAEIPALAVNSFENAPVVPANAPENAISPPEEIPAGTLNGSIVSAMLFSYIYTGRAVIMTLYVVLTVVGVTRNLILLSKSTMARVVVYVPRLPPLRITPY